MRANLNWRMMRLSIWLSELVPCPLTKRLRNANVSKCMHKGWY